MRCWMRVLLIRFDVFLLSSCFIHLLLVYITIASRALHGTRDKFYYAESPNLRIVVCHLITCTVNLCQWWNTYILSVFLCWHLHRNNAMEKRVLFLSTKNLNKRISNGPTTKQAKYRPNWRISYACISLCSPSPCVMKYCDRFHTKLIQLYCLLLAMSTLRCMRN